MLLYEALNIYVYILITRIVVSSIIYICKDHKEDDIN